jgi:hypothetical protein
VPRLLQLLRRKLKFSFTYLKSYLISPYLVSEGRCSLENQRIIMEKPYDRLIVERKAKQQFLSEEILEQQYDTEAFLQFCEKKKSSNIDEWSLDELALCVAEFKTRFAKKNQPAKPAAEPQKRSQSTPGRVAEPTLSLPQLEMVFGKMNTVTVSIEKSQSNELVVMNDIKVIVCNPEIVDPGFLSAKFYVFTVNTQPVNWIVKRKVEEFLWLREMLMAYFPGIAIPGLHRSTKAKLETKGLFKRQVMYSSFLNNAVAKPVLRTGNCLLAFLKEQDLKAVVRSWKKPAKIREVSEIRNIEGELICAYEEMSEKFENINAFLMRSEKVLTELMERVKKLIVDSVNLSEAIKNYAVSIRDLQANYSIIKNYSAISTYKEVEESLVKWSEYTINSTTYLYEELKVPFKIYKLELLSLKELLKERESIWMSYRSSLGKPNAAAAKDLFGYFNYSSLLHSQSVMNDAITQLKERLASGFSRKTEEITQFHLVWGSLLSGLN